MGGTPEKEASPGKNLEKTQHLRSRIMQIQHIDSGRTANKTGGKLGLWSQRRMSGLPHLMLPRDWNEPPEILPMLARH